MCLFGVREFEDNILKLICLTCSLLLVPEEDERLPKEESTTIPHSQWELKDQLQED